MKGYGIFIGVDEIDVGHYRSQHTFQGAKYNAEAMYEIAEGTALYDINRKDDLLIGNRATWENAKRLLEFYAEKSQECEEGYLLATFSGHGYSKNKNPHGTPKKAQDETLIWEFLCFHDRMVPESEIRSILLKFNRKFKVVLVVDSCFSGGIALARNSSYYTRKKSSIVEAISSKELMKVYSLDDLYQSEQSFYDDLMKKFPNVDPEYIADICYFNACENDQRALLGRRGQMSPYTKYLYLLWNSKKFEGNYNDLNALLKDGLPKENSPTIRIFPKRRKSFFFRRTVPFNFTRKYMPKYMQWHIKPAEFKDQDIRVEIIPPSKEYYVNHILIKPGNKPGFGIVKKYMRDMMLKVEYIIIVKVHQLIIPRRSLSIASTVNAMKSTDPKGMKNGIYILFDFENGNVLSHSFTNGTIAIK